MGIPEIQKMKMGPGQWDERNLENVLTTQKCANVTKQQHHLAAERNAESQRHLRPLNQTLHSDRSLGNRNARYPV